uniref:Crinkler effector protein 4 n=2 Tax=Phytophthora capsici TaxID=4784 RepID=CRN4_PHYCP|eukprot:jgi/Phyca11/511381/fgenesh2_kg.PHYCAscaffold_83_\
MVKLSLQCAVVDQAGSSFDVEIDDSAKVSKLKKVIKEENPATITCDAKDLQLFLAKKDDAWLDGAGAAAVELDEHGHPQGCVQMDPTLWVKNPKHFGDNFQPGEGQVHVLVVVPEGVVGSASETSKMDFVVDKVSKLYEHSVLSKRTRYVHSEMSSSKGNKLVKELKIRVTPVDAVPFTGGSPTPVEEFEWIKGRTEEQQSGRYRDYVEANIGDVLRNNKLCVFSVEKGANILSVEVPGCDVDLAGRTDMIVLSAIVQKFPHYLPHLPGVKMLIEVKREVKSASEFQALSELIAMDFIVDESVMALLTNLTNHWEFLWVSNKSNNRPIIATTTLTTPGEAFEVIRTLLAQSSTADADIMLPCLAEPVKRRKLNQMLPFIGEASGDGIRESIERYYDIASCLGPDFDMARAVARQVTRSIPTLSYFS